MKKFVYAIVFFLLIGLVPVDAKEKVKVYIFEAGGCPYCEAEVEYLKSLQETNSHFEIVEKELYVDHIDWEAGKDYELGVKVAVAFQNAKFEYASYQVTPFIVISDLCAAATYDNNLESFIEEAYEEGDKDIVGCFEKGKDTCAIRPFLTEVDKRINSVEDENNKQHVIIYVLIVALVLYSAYLTYKVFQLKNNKPVSKRESFSEETKPEHKKNKKKK